MHLDGLLLLLILAAVSIDIFGVGDELWLVNLRILPELHVSLANKLPIVLYQLVMIPLKVVAVNADQ